MFSKLRNLSEDLAKSINQEFAGEGAPGGPRRATDTTKILKNGQEILHKSTPDAADLTQPSDEPSSEMAPNASKEASPVVNERPSTPLEDLPPDIRLKMKKFAKYEDKYPVLLEAYKVEKRKTELIAMFEKILQESTPISSILEAGALVEYLNGLTEKASMLNSELRRVTGERGKLERRVGEVERSEIELKGKIEQLEESKVESDAKLAKTQAELLQLKEKSEQLPSSTETTIESTEGLDNDKIKELESEVISLKLEVTSLTEALEKAEKEKEAAIADSNSNAKALEEAQADLQNLKDLDESKQMKQNLERASSEIEQLKSTLAAKSKEIDIKLAEKDGILAERDAELSKKVKLIDVIQKENSDNKEKYETTIHQLEAKIAEREPSVNKVEESIEKIPVATVSTTSSKKNKKKKKNGGKQESNHELKPEMKSETSIDNTTQTETDTLLEETRKELHQVKEQLVQKTDDVEELRDLLRDLGDELVVAKDKLKEFTKKQENEDGNSEKLKSLSNKITILETTVAEKEEEILKLQTTLESKENRISELSANVSELDSAISTKNKEIESSKANHTTLTNEHKLLQQNIKKSQETISQLNKELTALKADKATYESRIAELQKFKSNDASLKLEISNIKSTQAKKDSTIKELNDKINALTQERDKLTGLLSTLEEKHSQINEMNKILVNEKSQLVTKQELAFERERRLSEEILKLQTDKNKVVTDLEGIRNKYDILSKQRASTTDEAQTLRQQFDELHMKTREQVQKIESLEDDLNEARNLLQERTRELQQMRRVLLDAEDQASLRASEIKSKMSQINEDRVEFEKQAQNLLKKKQREVDEAKLITANYLLKIQELEGVLSEIRSKNENGAAGDYDILGSDGQLNEAQKTIETLQELLQTQTKRSKEFENLNSVLKRLNEEANHKFERLQKNYKIVQQQYSKAKEEASGSVKQRSSTPVVVESDPSTEKSQEESVAYLKNVLLGYFEHKDQRDSLLPVLRMLFQFTPEDETKFAQALK